MTTRRRAPWLLVELNGSAESYDALVWALREGARREATVVAVGVLPCLDDALPGTTRHPDAVLDATHARLDTLLHQAMEESDVFCRCRVAVMERPVFDALTAAVHGSDLVVVGADGKRLLRPAVPRPTFRRTARGA